MLKRPTNTLKRPTNNMLKRPTYMQVGKRDPARGLVGMGVLPKIKALLDVLDKPSVECLLLHVM